MFINNAFFLFTQAVKDRQFGGGHFTFEALSTRRMHNGLLVKDTRGNSFEMKTGKQNADMHLILHYGQDVHGSYTSRTIRLNDLFAERVVTYLRDYYGEYHTNCSTFVEYLRTGNFCECDAERLSFMLSGGMNRYTGQKIRPGDSLCIFYYNKWGRSRKGHKTLRNHYRKKDKNVSGDLEKLKSVTGYRFSSEELLKTYRHVVYADYHFMFCIGIHDGQPVFIQQMGLNDSRESTDLTPIIVSVGMTNMSNQDIPACMFIKRGRL
ncbi:MAG TPA: hypothetical protein VMV62_01620 [Candidatus Paceibacterota bacterium]|nr:hypothetical protein [Candidatus Paceibacterota bacterium]